MNVGEKRHPLGLGVSVGSHNNQSQNKNVKSLIVNNLTRKKCGFPAIYSYFAEAKSVCGSPFHSLWVALRTWNHFFFLMSKNVY